MVRAVLQELIEFLHFTLTDNGKEFTDRLFASRECEPSGSHEFDQRCQELGAEHRLTKRRPREPMAWWSVMAVSQMCSQDPQVEQP